MTTPPLREQHGTLILRAGIVVYASEGAAAVVGRPVADIVGRRVVDLIVPEQRAAIEERHFRRLRGEVVPAASEVTVLLPDGGRRLVEAHAERDGADVLHCPYFLGPLRRVGARVVLTESTRWLGGQLTAQAVPPDEHPWVETTGTTSAASG